MSNSIIQIFELSKTYPKADKKAVDNLNLEIKKGQIYGFLGPNGAGKTTTINMLSGLSDYDSGKVLIDGIDISIHQNSIKKIIGLVPQNIALYQELTAYENLIFFGKLHYIPNKVLKDRIDYALDRLGLFDKKNQKVKQYSGGMKRRINLIAGLLHEPKLLILDEPTVGVDVQSKQTIINFLLELNQSGTSILYTSHMMEEAERICNQISIIDQGRIIESGSPEHLKSKFNKNNLEAVFLHLTGHQLRD